MPHRLDHQQECSWGQIKVGSAIELSIETSFVTPSEPFDPYAPGIPSDNYLFRFSTGANTLTLLNANNKIHSSDILNSVRNIYDLCTAIEGLNNNPWLWVDALITLSFNTNQQVKSDLGDEWTVYNIWDRFLSKFRPWL